MNRGNLKIILSIILLGAGAVYLYLTKNSRSSGPADYSAFAIADTGLVSRFTITDFNGRTVDVRRAVDSPLWDVNGKFKARKDAVDLLLKTFKRIQVKNPVADAARDNVMRMLAGAGKMVEIYSGGDSPEKIWYVGTPTPDHFGTHMLLELPGRGKSEDPYVMHLSGFSGILNTRFFTDEQDWRYTGLYHYPTLDFASVRLENLVLPSQGFEIKYGGGNDISLLNAAGEVVPVFDTITVKEHLLLFKRVHMESHVSCLESLAEDSVLRQSPHFVLTVTERTGAKKRVALYRKTPSSDLSDMHGTPAVWDLDRLYGTTDGKDLFLVQSYTFGPILCGIERFAIDRPLGAQGYLWYR